MKNIEDINKAAIKKIVANKKITDFSPGDTIKVVRSGKVRRAKLYYLRDRKGESARIAEKIKKKIGIDVSIKNETQQDLAQTESSKKSEVETKTDELSEKKSETQKSKDKK